MTEQIQQPDFPQQGTTANDRLKRSFSVWFAGSIAAATAVHFLVFAFWPTMGVVAEVHDPNVVEVVTAPEIDIPEPPEPIARPAVPVITDTPIELEVPFASTTFGDNPPENLPPPPGDATKNAGSILAWTTYDVRPTYRNKDEIERALESEYPPLLRDAGIGGTAVVLFLINEKGKVLETKLQTSSGHTALDEAALEVAEVAEFTPAMNRDKPVPVWIALPITFRTR